MVDLCFGLWGEVDFGDVGDKVMVLCVLGEGIGGNGGEG